MAWHRDGRLRKMTGRNSVNGTSRLNGEWLIATRPVRPAETAIDPGKGPRSKQMRKRILTPAMPRRAWPDLPWRENDCRAGRRVKRWAAITLLPWLALMGCSRNAEQADGKATARGDGAWPNIVVILVDTLRADHLGCYGFQRNMSPLSPRIDRLAAEGALFEHAISSTSWTLPAHCALLTGLADSVHGCLEEDQQLDESRLTLAERLSASGYRSVGFFSGPLLHPVFGVAQGFDCRLTGTRWCSYRCAMCDSGTNGWMLPANSCPRRPPQRRCCRSRSAGNSRASGISAGQMRMTRLRSSVRGFDLRSRATRITRAEQPTTVAYDATTP